MQAEQPAAVSLAGRSIAIVIERLSQWEGLRPALEALARSGIEFDVFAPPAQIKETLGTGWSGRWNACGQNLKALGHRPVRQVPNIAYRYPLCVQPEGLDVSVSGEWEVRFPSEGMAAGDWQFQLDQERAQVPAQQGMQSLLAVLTVGFGTPSGLPGELERQLVTEYLRRGQRLRNADDEEQMALRQTQSAAGVLERAKNTVAEAEYLLSVAAISKPIKLARWLVMVTREFIRGNRQRRSRFLRWIGGQRQLGDQMESNYIRRALLIAQTGKTELAQAAREMQISASRLEHRQAARAPGITRAIAAAPGAPKPLSGYEYKFFRFLQKREAQFRVDLSRIKAPSESGLVSVILPVYNGEDLVEESIRSVLAQQYARFELIIVDDGSTDRTPAIVDRYAALDPRIRVVHQANQKLPKALNNGFALARGEFCTWTSADNNMHPDFLSRLVGFMQDNPDLAMCFANVRLIDQHGLPIENNTWYPAPGDASTVALPHGTLELNTYPNNTICAAFLYRRAVPALLGGYNESLFTVEDYDYWQRVNAFFSIRHTDFDDPIYDYRFHDKSLTAQAKQLRIDAIRDQLMLTEEFRQDFLLRPLCWNLEGPHGAEWEARLEEIGHLCLREAEIKKLAWARAGANLVQVTFAQGKQAATPPPRLTPDSVLVLVRDGEPAKGDGAFDLRIACQAVTRAAPEGWLLADSWLTALNMIHIFAKSHILQALDALERGDTPPELAATIVLCTYRRIDQACQALRAMIDQDFSKEDYEILVINNDPANPAMRAALDEIARSEALPDGFLRYVECPFKGLSAARNSALFEARGAVVLYVDDDGIMDAHCLSALITAFSEHPEAGVIGGQILLKDPQRFRQVILDQYESIWSEFRIDGKEYLESVHDYELPYGCNYAVRRAVLRCLGGFRTTYGRVGKDYAGGEEIVLSLLAQRMGLRVGRAPGAIVIHDVDPARFTLEHVRQTFRASHLTNYAMKMDLYRPYDAEMWEEHDRLTMLSQDLRQMALDRVDPTSLPWLYKRFALDATLETLGTGNQNLNEIEARGAYRDTR